MAVGDPWEISLAVPFVNARCTEWRGDVTNGPVGWRLIDPLNAVNIRSDGRSGQPCAYFTDGAAATVRAENEAGPASISSVGVYVKAFAYYKSSAAPFLKVRLRTSSGGQTSEPSGGAGIQADWYLWQSSVVNVTQGSGAYSAAIDIYMDGSNDWIQISEFGARYTPGKWSTDAYETLTDVPLPDGLFYGAMPNGKWKLTASYEHLSDSDYQILRRYHLANGGALDGIPRPVCIRPYLEDGTAGPYVEFLVGSFTEFSFAPNNLSGTHAGSFTIEEF